MRFSVVDVGYDRAEVDLCLAELAHWSARVVRRLAGGVTSELDLLRVREAAARLDDLVKGALPDGSGPLPVRQIAELLARAQAEVTAAEEEARQIRDRAYAEAVQARRDFEAALHARRIREERADRILRDFIIGQPGPGDCPASAPEQAPPLDSRADANIG